MRKDRTTDPPMTPLMTPSTERHATHRKDLSYDGLCDAFFVSEAGAPLTYRIAGWTFASLARRLGLRGPVRVAVWGSDLSQRIQGASPAPAWPLVTEPLLGDTWKEDSLLTCQSFNETPRPPPAPRRPSWWATSQVSCQKRIAPPRARRSSPIQVPTAVGLTPFRNPLGSHVIVRRAYPRAGPKENVQVLIHNAGQRRLLPVPGMGRMVGMVSARRNTKVQETARSVLIAGGRTCTPFQPSRHLLPIHRQDNDLRVFGWESFLPTPFWPL